MRIGIEVVRIHLELIRHRIYRSWQLHTPAVVVEVRVNILFRPFNVTSPHPKVELSALVRLKRKSATGSRHKQGRAPFGLFSSRIVTETKTGDFRKSQQEFGR